ENADSGSDHEARGGGDASDSEPEPPRPADSEEEEEGSSPVKRRASTSDIEEEEEEEKPHPVSDSEPEETQKRHSPKSDAASDSDEDKPKQKTLRDSDKAVMNSDSDEEEEKPKQEAGSDEDEGPKRRALASDEDEKPGMFFINETHSFWLNCVSVKRKKAVLSDSDEDEEKEVKKSRLVSDDEDSGSDDGSGAPDKSLAAKLKELGSDSEDEEDTMKRDAGTKDEKALFGSDSESGDDEEEKMIADIFGESGEEEEEEFTGFNQEELEAERPQTQAPGHKRLEDDSDSDEDVDRGGKDMSFMSDFEIMLARKKAQSGKRRRNRDGGTFISDADDVVSAMITKMTEAAEEDRTLNSQKKPALKKLMLLPTVVMHLKNTNTSSLPFLDLFEYEWSRPIFGLSSNYKGMTREEREQRDLDQQIAPRRRLSSGGQTPRRDLEKVLTGEEKALRPGDPGFCARARVPMPSNKDYVVRPKWNVDVDSNRVSGRGMCVGGA
uniref:Interacts with SUPT6H, CTD assembly factor 1 n=1 Tax=Cyprinus carpio TaxID=7962 RepID=A0A8C1PN53_CYPCA